MWLEKLDEVITEEERAARYRARFRRYNRLVKLDAPEVAIHSEICLILKVRPANISLSKALDYFEAKHPGARAYWETEQRRLRTVFMFRLFHRCENLIDGKTEEFGMCGRHRRRNKKNSPYCSSCTRLIERENAAQDKWERDNPDLVAQIRAATDEMFQLDGR